jgi:regulator of nucleoside diphosphate kinase
MDLKGQLRYKDCGRALARRHEEVEVMRRNNRIVLSSPDARRLRSILGSRRGSIRDRAHLEDLYEEIEQARIVDEDHIDPNVVTMEAKVRVRDSETGAFADYVVVPPDRAELSAGRISVLAPLGTALLGYREGDEVEWQMPGGVRRLRIERVSQPERAASEREEDVAI